MTRSWGGAKCPNDKGEKYNKDNGAISFKVGNNTEGDGIGVGRIWKQYCGSC